MKEDLMINIGFRFVCKTKHSPAVLYYRDSDQLEVCFHLSEKSIYFGADTGEEIFGNRIYNSFTLSIEELIAIQKTAEYLFSKEVEEIFYEE